MSENKTSAPLVSVIVPCYNGEKYLTEALNSVFAQTYENWECIIMDDGSIDNSKQIALAFENKDNRFKYFYQGNRGPSAARNNAIKQSKGKYILPLDADDKISTAYIEKAVKVMEDNRNIKVVYCKAKLFGKFWGSWDIPEFSYRNLLIENLIFCTAMFKREDFDKTHGYDQTMREGFEDWDFWLTFIGENDKVFRLPKVHFYYRQKETSRNNVLDIAMQNELRKRIFEKHKDLYDKYFTMPEIIFDYYRVTHQFADSKDFRLGKSILAPYRFLRNLFR